MFYQEPQQATVPASGEPTSKIVIVGEAPGRFEILKGKPFVGPAGTVLETCLHAAGLTRAECYVTNLANYYTKGEKLYNPRKDALTVEGQKCAERLAEELGECSPHIIVPMGGPASCAITGTGKITKTRGYLFKPIIRTAEKAIPTLHPASTMRGEFLKRHYIVHDLTKVKSESEYPELRLPDDPIYIPMSYEETHQLLQQIKDLPSSQEANVYLSVDIETNNHEVSCIGFAVVENGEAKMAITVPMQAPNSKIWTLEEETQLWTDIAEIMGRPDLHKLFQNGVFDMFFLVQRLGIYTRGTYDDTMIAHHIIYPEFLKGLEFLGSLYCHRPHWKSMVNFKAKDKMKSDD